MYVLVTGGCGFIGSHVVDALVDDGADVLVLDSLDVSTPYFHPQATYVRGDDVRFLGEHSSRIGAIVYLAAIGGVSRAAREPARVIENNAGAFARLLDQARSWPALRRIVLASSFSVYGNGQIMPITTVSVPSPTEPYGASKYMQELCLRGFAAAPCTILRFSSVYGRRMRLDDSEATIVARIAGWVRDGTRPQVFEDGQQTRDFVHVQDVVDTIRASLRGDAPDLLNVCSGHPVTLLDACRLVAQAMGKSCEPELTGQRRSGDMRHCYGNASMLATVLGRAPVRFDRGAVQAFG